MVKNCHVLDRDRNFREKLLFHSFLKFRFISFICQPSVGTEKKITLKIHRIPFCGFFKILL